MSLMINHRLRLLTKDGKTILGQLIAFDKHMNVVLADAEEFRDLTATSKTKKGKKSVLSESSDAPKLERRVLGLVVLRGESIVSIVVESGPPPASSEGKKRVSASVALIGAGGAMLPRGQTVPSQRGPMGGVGSMGVMGPMGAMIPPMMPGMPPMPMPGMSMPGMPGMPMMPPMPPMMPGMSFPPMMPPMPGMPMPPMMPGMPPMPPPPPPK